MVFQKIENGYVVRMEKGEEIIDTLSDFIDKNKIKGGFVWGIGTVNNITLGYYDAQNKKYIKKTFEDDFEITNLTGNISSLNGSPLVHAHITISDSNFSALSGHLFSGIIAVTAEFVIFSTENKIERALDPQTGLNLLKL